MKAPILVAACGNPHAGDDAFGPMVLRHLQPLASPQMELLDLSMNPAELLDHLSDRQALILVDAVVSPDHAEGELLDLDCSDVARLPLELKAAGSSHNFGLSWQLRLAASLQIMPPHARLVALVISTPEVGDAMSASLWSKIPRAGEMVLRWVRHYTVTPA